MAAFLSLLLLEALLGRLPIDDVPDGIEIFGFAVFILQTSRSVSIKFP